jgi:hypothetical protein
MKPEHPAPDAVELLLLAVLVALDAVAVLAVALVALVVTITRLGPVRSPARVMASPPPAVHPLALVAEELEALPVARLRPMAGTRPKRVRKAELVALVAAC